MIKLYGIPNCDTVRKARKWLQANGVDYTFHDFRKQGVPEDRLRDWVERWGWETVLNRRGTTWRKLDEKTRNTIDEAAAIDIMLENPAIIKRPVLQSGGTLLLGFNEADYRRIAADAVSAAADPQ